MYLAGFVGGLLMGAIFFLGLYMSVRKMTNYKHPAVFIFITTTLRMLIVLSGFYLLSFHGAIVMLLALLGVVSMRIVIVRWQKSEIVQKNSRG